MILLTPIILFTAGLLLLIKGADWLVDGASAIARRFGVSDLVIGLTIVSFGTSAPELLVNIIASFNGSADIAIGNIVGSNISNTLLILGTTALIAPLAIQRSTVLKEIPFSLLASVILLVMANDVLVDNQATSMLSRGDGIVLLGFFIIFIYYTFGIGRIEDGHTTEKQSFWLSSGMILGGLLGLSVGGHLAVTSAQEIALSLGVSEAFVGLTAVAIGTSLPELTASVVAALKNKPDISVGNIVGSNIFNILWILGLSAVIKPLPFSADINVDLLVALGAAVLLFVAIHNGHWHHRLLLWWKQKKDYILNKHEGAILLMCYVAYMIFVGYRG